jgi:hypothetical protein
LLLREAATSSEFAQTTFTFIRKLAHHRTLLLASIIHMTANRKA